MVYEFRAKWSRFPKHKPPCRGLYLITRQSEGIRIKIPNIKVAELFTKPFVDRAYYIEENSTWMDTRSGRKYGDVIAWMPMPKPSEVGLFFRLKLHRGDGEVFEVALACDLFEDNGDEEYDYEV